MATQVESARISRQASFRHLASGTIVNTGCFRKRSACFQARRATISRSAPMGKRKGVRSDGG